MTEEPVDEWIVLESVGPVHSANGAHRGGWRATLPVIAFVIGVTVSAAIGWSADRTAITPPLVQTAEAPPTVEALHAVGAALPLPTPIGPKRNRSLFVVIPADGNYVSSSRIAVAGTAFARPHGWPISAVHIELFVGGRLIERADLDVFSSRFAGVIELRPPIARAEAELRITDPSRPGGGATVRRFTINAGTSPLRP